MNLRVESGPETSEALLKLPNRTRTQYKTLAIVTAVFDPTRHKHEPDCLHERFRKRQKHPPSDCLGDQGARDEACLSIGPVRRAVLSPAGGLRMTNAILFANLAVLVVNLLVLVRIAYLLADARASLSRTEVRLELQKDF